MRNLFTTMLLIATLLFAGCTRGPVKINGTVKQVVSDIYSDAYRTTVVFDDGRKIAFENDLPVAVTGKLCTITYHTQSRILGEPLVTNVATAVEVDGKTYKP